MNEKFDTKCFVYSSDIKLIINENVVLSDFFVNVFLPTCNDRSLSEQITDLCLKFSRLYKTDDDDDNKTQIIRLF